MPEFPTFVAMGHEEFIYKRAQGIISLASFVDHIRQPGVVAICNRKPVFVWNNPAEEALLMAGDVEGLFELRGYNRTEVTNDPPEGPKITIP